MCFWRYTLVYNIFSLVYVVHLFYFFWTSLTSFVFFEYLLCYLLSSLLFFIFFFFCFTLQWNNIITFSHFPSLLLTLAALHLLIHCWWCLRFCCIGYIYCMFKFNDSHCVLFVEFFAYKMFENFYVLRT